MKNIFDIINYYSKNNMLLDNSAVKKIIETLLYINNVNFNYDINIFNHFHSLDNKNALAYFDYKSIKVYLNRLKKFLNDKESRIIHFLIEDELNKYESFLFKNIYIFRIIMHEIEHLLQYENKLEGYSNIEKRLIDIERSFVDDKASSTSKIYDLNDKISFIERISEIYALEKTNDFLFDYVELTEKIIDINSLYLLNAQMAPYISYKDSPTERFFRNIGKYNEFSKIDFSDISYGERLRYGLELDEKEFFYNKNELALAIKRK